MRQPYVVPRRRLLFAVWLTVVALPILVIDNIPRTEARAASVKTASADALDPSPTERTAPPPTEVPTTEAPTTEAAAVVPGPSSTGSQRGASRPAAKAPATTTTSPPTTAPPTTEAAPNEQAGGASWYDYQPGECAHLSIPKGTVVTVTRISTGASVTCVVTDRGPHGGGRIIDLDRDTFAQTRRPGRRRDPGPYHLVAESPV